MDIRTNATQTCQPQSPYPKQWTHPIHNDQHVRFNTIKPPISRRRFHRPSQFLILSTDLCPIDASHSGRTASGRRYSREPGSSIDI